MFRILIIVCAVIGSLGVLSAIFGFSAEGTKLTPYNILVLGDECIYPQNPALGLGICAAVFLLAAQVTFRAVGGCCGCCNKSGRSNPSETKRIVGIVCAVVSWIAAVIALVLLIEGAAWNANVVRTTAPNCYYLKDGIFAGAGVLSLAATALGVTSYVLMRTTKRVKAAAPAPGVPAEGEPKLPPSGATQGNNGSPRNQELQLPPADTVTVPPPAMASAPPEPAGQPPPPPPAGAEMGQQPPVQLPQVGVPNDTIQYTVQQGPEDLIREELTKAGIRLAARVVEHSLFADSITTPTTIPGVGDIVVSMTDLQSTDAA